MSLRHSLAQVAHRAGNQLEIAADLLVAAERVKAFLFNGFQQHGLFIRAQLSHFVKKQHAAVGAAQQPCTLLSRQ